LPGPTSSEGITQFVANIAKEENKKPEQIEKEVFTSLRPTSLLERVYKTKTFRILDFMGFQETQEIREPS
ncbi:hypothetical protein ACN4Z3_17405, partial [Legionella sp. 29fVS95]